MYRKFGLQAIDKHVQCNSCFLGNNYVLTILPLLTLYFSRDDEQYTYQFKSMIISVCLQLYIIWVEIMTVVNLDVGDTPIPWSAVFSPIYILMLISIPSCIWGCYRKRGVEVCKTSCGCIYLLMLLD